MLSIEYPLKFKYGIGTKGKVAAEMNLKSPESVMATFLKGGAVTKQLEPLEGPDLPYSDASGEESETDEREHMQVCLVRLMDLRLAGFDF